MGAQSDVYQEWLGWLGSSSTTYEQKDASASGGRREKRGEER